MSVKSTGGNPCRRPSSPLREEELQLQPKQPFRADIVGLLDIVKGLQGCAHGLHVEAKQAPIYRLIDGPLMDGNPS